MPKPSNHGGARPGAGRPALPDDEVRTARLTVRLRDAELELLDAIARREGLKSRSAAVTWLLSQASRLIGL